MHNYWKSICEGGKRGVPLLAVSAALLAAPVLSFGQARTVQSAEESRYRGIDDERAFDSLRQREQRRAARAEVERRRNPGPGLPSLEQQQLDRETAVQEAYDRQRAARIGRPHTPGAMRQQPGQLR